MARRLPETLTILCPALAALALWPAIVQAQDAAAGERLFQQRCASCHALEEGENRAGPHLAGVIGRPAGDVEGARYSRGMRDLDVTWDATTLSEFIANPREMVRGTAMSVSIRDADDRASIVAYLTTLSEPAN